MLARAGINLVNLGAGISGFGKIDVAFGEDTAGRPRRYTCTINKIVIPAKAGINKIPSKRAAFPSLRLFNGSRLSPG
jgi:hypothetical protein